MRFGGRVVQFSNDDLLQIIEKYTKDRESLYNIWFINGGERLKAFRSIERELKR